jgi:hypothetical protein
VGVDSQPDIGKITRRWYPGVETFARPPTGQQEVAASKPGTLPGGTDAGHWESPQAQGEGDADSLESFGQSRVPWLTLPVTVQRILPVGMAALVGALTALAWQSFGARPKTMPALRPAQQASAVQPHAREGRTQGRPLTDQVLVPTSTKPATVPATDNGQRMLPGPAAPLPVSPVPAPVTLSWPAVAADQQATQAKARTQGARLNRNHVARPSATPVPGPSPDPDATLKPSFM